MSITSKVNTFIASADKVALIRSEFHRQYVRILRPIRLGSKPYISGDTFRAIADFRLDKITPRTLQALGRHLSTSGSDSISRMVLFVDLKSIQDVKSQETLLRFFNSVWPVSLRSLSIVLHNHDKIPDPEFFLTLNSLGARVYSPNVLQIDNTVCAIPLGIENRNFRKNGVLRHFTSSPVDQKRSANERDISIFGAFNIGTNPTERTRAARAIIENNYLFVTSRMTPRKFQESLRRSLFVISPPGNGIDCHRTWEAIYFGAVPVVQKGALSETLWGELPILAVDDWNEVCQLRRNELETLFCDLRSKPIDLAYFEHWEKNLRN